MEQDMNTKKWVAVGAASALGLGITGFGTVAAANAFGIVEQPAAGTPGIAVDRDDRIGSAATATRVDLGATPGSTATPAPASTAAPGSAVAPQAPAPAPQAVSAQTPASPVSVQSPASPVSVVSPATPPSPVSPATPPSPVSPATPQTPASPPSPQSPASAD
jgi:hypothetical protein